MTVQTVMLTTIETAAVNTLASSISHIGVGTGTSTPIVTQTQLDAETIREEIFTSATTVNTFTSALYLDVTENNGEVVREIGVFNSSSGATMVSRNLTTVSTKTSSKEFYYDVKYTITATSF